MAPTADDYKRVVAELHLAGRELHQAAQAMAAVAGLHMAHTRATAASRRALVEAGIRTPVDDVTAGA